MTGKEAAIVVVLIGIVIGFFTLLLVGSANKAGVSVENEMKSYDYITVEGETFETKDITEVRASGGYDRYYEITLKDGTKIVAEGYILRNKSE